MTERSRERELLLAWRAGDRKAGSELIRSHARLVQRFFANKVGKPEQVEELAQRTFAACVDGVERFRGDSNFRTWLFAIANNVLREYFRESRRNDQLDFASVSLEDAGAPGHSTLLAASREQQRLITALRRISIDSQVLLELYYWEELTAPELAEVFSVPVGTIRGRISKAKLELRSVLDTMERTHEQPTTEAQLDDWARQVRAQL